MRMFQEVTRITALVCLLFAITAATSTSAMAQGGSEKTSGPALAPLASMIDDGSSKVLDGAKQMQEAEKIRQNQGDIAKVKQLMVQADKNIQAGKQALTEAKSRIAARKEMMPKKDECKLMMQSAEKKGQGMMCMGDTHAADTQTQLTQDRKSREKGVSNPQNRPTATQ